MLRVYSQYAKLGLLSNKVAYLFASYHTDTSIMLTRLTLQLSIGLWLVLGAISLLVHATAKQHTPENQVVYVASLLSKRQLYTADLDREISWATLPFRQP